MSICREIDVVFDRIMCRNSTWTYNGSDDYLLMGLSQITLMKKLILREYPKRKEFYFLDIGAGDFESINTLSNELNRDEAIPKDIVVHCIGVRGEFSLEPEIVQDGFCRCYKFGTFKIECLEQAFADKELFLENKIDLIVSKWTFRHLVDPLGTFLQSYALLRHTSGLMLADGWFFDLSD